MQINLKPLPPLPVSKQTIDIDGIQIGTVETVTDATSYKFHVILKSKHQINIYQGFGLTVNEALQDAVTRAKKQRMQELDELLELKQLIWRAI